MTASQLSLFEGAPDGRKPNPVQPAEVPPYLAEVAAALPENLHLGTSSWSFPGWAGFVYRRSHSPQTLSRHGLDAYARHPLLTGVGLDRTHYRPMTAEALAAMAEAVPENFRFVVKAHEDSTVRVFPEHPRYGTRRGETNPRFLDPAYATDQIVQPFVEGLGEKGGVLLFQLAPQEMAGDFIDRLHDFLRRLPSGPRYAVELRNRELLGPPWAEALADAGTLHCLNLHPRMPDVGTQARLSGALEGKALVIRWMLQSHLTYGDARRRYQPYTRLMDEDPTARRTVAALATNALGAGKRVFTIANNKAEGSAPHTLFELARTIARLRAAQTDRKRGPKAPGS
ncbi:MAG: DUF72 domain-containing protein [Acidobacteriota bacterium]